MPGRQPEAPTHTHVHTQHTHHTGLGWAGRKGDECCPWINGVTDRGVPGKLCLIHDAATLPPTTPDWTGVGEAISAPQLGPAGRRWLRDRSGHANAEDAPRSRDRLPTSGFLTVGRGVLSLSTMACLASLDVSKPNTDWDWIAQPAASKRSEQSRSKALVTVPVRPRRGASIPRFCPFCQRWQAVTGIRMQNG